MAKKLNKRFKIKYPQFFGLTEREEDYIFKETKFGYVCQFEASKTIGFPKSIIEKNPEIYIRIEDGTPYTFEDEEMKKLRIEAKRKKYIE